MIRLSKTSWPCLGIVAFLLSCSTPTRVPPLTPQETPVFQAAATGPESIAYPLSPGDTIRIRYPFHPELDREDVIRPDGRIRVAQVGEVVVAGRSVADVEALLEEKTAAWLRDPDIVVNVVRYARKPVYVAGEVTRPGPIEYRKGLTILHAIAEAGGFRETALTEQIVLIRATPEGRRLSRTIDAQKVVTQGVQEPVNLTAFDVVFVPRTSIAEADLWVDQHVTRLFPLFRGVGGSNIRVGQNE